MRRDDTCVADPSSKKMVLYMAYHNKILAMDQTGKIHRQVKPLDRKFYTFLHKEKQPLQEKIFSILSVEFQEIICHSDFPWNQVWQDFEVSKIVILTN